jgi:hypothetical protein
VKSKNGYPKTRLQQLIQEEHCCLSNSAFAYSPLFNQEGGQPFNLRRVTFYNFNGARRKPAFLTSRRWFSVSPSRSSRSSTGSIENKMLTAALENGSGSLTGAVNCYPVDERQVVDRADCVGLAACVVANFDLYDRQAKVPSHDSMPGLVKGTTAKRVTRVTHLGRSRVVPQPFRLDKETESKIRPRYRIPSAQRLFGYLA